MIQGLIFDINGTVTDILTNEGYDDIYRVLSNFLDYQGIVLPPDDLRHLYFDMNKRQRRTSIEEFPEFDVVEIFREIINVHSSAFTLSLSNKKRSLLPEILAELFRAASRFKLQTYPRVQEVLDELRLHYKLSAVSDGQSIWAIPELQSVGLLEYFDPIVVSSDLGYRKPDARMFEAVLKKMKLTAEEVLFIGNDMYRDVFGAKRLGIKTVFFQSNQGDWKNRGEEPDYIIYDFGQLPEAVRFLQEKAAFGI